MPDEPQQPPGPKQSEPIVVDPTVLRQALSALVLVALAAAFGAIVAHRTALGPFVLGLGFALTAAGIVAAVVNFAGSIKIQQTITQEAPPDSDAVDTRTVPVVVEAVEAIAKSIGSLPAWIAMLLLGLVITGFGALLDGYTLFGDDVLLPQEIRRTETAVASNCARAEFEQAVRWTATAENATWERSSTAAAQQVAWTATAQWAPISLTATFVAEVPGTLIAGETTTEPAMGVTPILMGEGSSATPLPASSKCG